MMDLSLQHILATEFLKLLEGSACRLLPVKDNMEITWLAHLKLCFIKVDSEPACPSHQQPPLFC